MKTNSCKQTLQTAKPAILFTSEPEFKPEFTGEILEMGTFVAVAPCNTNHVLKKE